MKGGASVWIVVGAAIVLALLALGRASIERRPASSIASTYDTGRNGYRALYAVLSAAGVPLERFERPLPLLSARVRTLVITGYEYDPSAKDLDAHDVGMLRSFVRKGGRLVEIDTAFAGTLDIAPAVGLSVPAAGVMAVALARNRYTAGVARVRGPIESAFRFRDRHGIPLLANQHGIVAMLYRYGKGDVVAITVPALFANAHLREADNLRFAYDVIAGHGAAAFDEYVHGYDDEMSLWSVLPASVRTAVWIAIAAIALALIGANVPFAPPYLPTPPDERDSSAYVAAMAALMRRARAARAAIDVFAGSAERLGRLGADKRARAAVAELAALAAASHPSDAMVLRAAILSFRLRKDRT